MAHDLPDDVWSQIAQSALSDRGALHNMSLTSRRIHRLVVPVLFRYLEFHTYRVESESLMARLIRNGMRARFLVNFPELLRHTRSFTLWENPYTLRSITAYLALHDAWDDSSSDDDAPNFLAVLHDAIFRLISRMPGLRELRLSNIVMTPLSYAAISSCPLLTSLALEPRHIPDITHITPALPEALRLRDFDYYCDPLMDNDRDRSPDPYLTDILDHCILSLEKLSISPVLLPLVVSRIPLHRMLSLRSLTVGLPLRDDLAVATFLQLLRASPQLRHLDLTGELPDIEPSDNLPPLSLSNLSTISGTPRLLKLVARGRTVVKIHLFATLNIKERPLTQIIRSSPTHLRDLSLWHVVVSDTPHEFLTFIRSLVVFRNLERLTIAYEHDMSWKDHVSAEDSHGAIKDLLSQLACLRFLDINCDMFGFVEGYDIGCPISKQGEPDDRGHPSLEALYVDFLCGMWSWDSRAGWERSDWAVPY